MDLTENLPHIELFYEQTYKKVLNYLIFMVIPKGQKCFIWFKNNSCIVINLNISSISNSRKIYTISNTYLKENNFNKLIGEGIGTILYGTLFNNNYFAIEDIFYYKNKQVSSDFLNKLNIINVMLKHDIYLSQNNNILFGVPFIKMNINTNNIDSLNNISYEIDEIKYILNDKVLYLKYNLNSKIQNDENRNENRNENKNRNKNININKKVFQIKATQKSDIYNLYEYNEITNNYEFYDVAFIPNYKTSIMMNKLFRNLKDHSNLDYLEESDEEDNYIDYDLYYNIECYYNYKFNKWVPSKIIEN